MIAKKSVSHNPEKLPKHPTSDAPLADWALWCAEVGHLTGAWKVFPCVTGEKRPLHKGWQDEAACDPKGVKVMWQNDPEANIGLAIQPGFVALDTDLYKPGAEAALDAFEAEHGELPRTLESRTARGGFHLIYSTAKTFGNGKGNLPDFGDVRGFGGFIVGPGSVFEGKRYQVENSSHPVALPEHVESMLREGRATLKDMRWDYGEPIPWDEKQARRLVEAVERGKLIKDYEGPFPEGERDNLTYQLFAEGKNRMIHPDVMLEAVEGSGIDGGLGDVVERKMQSAYYDGSTQDGYGSKVDAYWLPNYLFKRYVDGKPVDRAPDDPVEWKAANQDKLPNAFPGDPDRGEKTDGKTDPELAPLLIQSFAGLLAKEPQPVAEIIPDRIEKGAVNFLSGPGGSHKSRLALQYCVCIAARKPIFGKMPADDVTPVYIGAEDDESEIIRRMHKLAQRLEVLPDAVRETIYLDRTNRNNALVRMSEKGGYELTPFYNQLGDYVTGLPGHKFVVLDSCYDFVRFEGNSKVNEDAVNTFVKEVLGGFCRDTNSTLLVPWHPSYAGQERGDGSGWSVAWHNAPRVRDQIKRKGDAFELTAEKRNHGVFPSQLVLRYSDGAMLPLAEFDLSEQRAELSTACIEVAILCAEKGFPITQQRRIGKTEFDLLRERIEIEPSNTEMKDTLKRAAIEGHLVYLTGTKYRAAGYYPSDRSTELAKDAKKAKTEAKTGQKPGSKTRQKPSKNRG